MVCWNLFESDLSFPFEVQWNLHNSTALQKTKKFSVSIIYAKRPRQFEGIAGKQIQIKPGPLTKNDKIKQQGDLQKTDLSLNKTIIHLDAARQCCGLGRTLSCVWDNDNDDDGDDTTVGLLWFSAARPKIEKRQKFLGFIVMMFHPSQTFAFSLNTTANNRPWISPRLKTHAVTDHLPNLVWCLDDAFSAESHLNRSVHCGRYWPSRGVFWSEIGVGIRNVTFWLVQLTHIMDPSLSTPMPGTNPGFWSGRSGLELRQSDPGGARSPSSKPKQSCLTIGGPSLPGRYCWKKSCWKRTLITTSDHVRQRWLLASVSVWKRLRSLLTQGKGLCDFHTISNVKCPPPPESTECVEGCLTPRNRSLKATGGRNSGRRFYPLTPADAHRSIYFFFCSLDPFVFFLTFSLIFAITEASWAAASIGTCCICGQCVSPAFPWRMQASQQTGVHPDTNWWRVRLQHTSPVRNLSTLR